MPATTPPPRTVFVSHAHADNELCDRYVAALRDRGLDVWYDRTNMQDGHFLSDQISEELERRPAFVVFLTPASLASYWVRLEISTFRRLAAQDARRIMLPIRIAACEMPLLVAGIKWMDAVSLGFEAAVDAMAVALSAPAAPEASPTTQPTERVGELVRKGDELMALKKYGEAILVRERATQLYPRSLVAWVSLGLSYETTLRYGDALTAWERALALDEKQAWVWHSKGNTLNALNRNEEALVAFDRALALDPNSAGAWYDKSRVLIELGHFREAEQAERRADESS